MTWILVLRKMVLARRLRRRGICLQHGTRRIYDRSEGHMGTEGVVAGEWKCPLCEQQLKELVEKAEADYARETERMWEEYKGL